MAVWRDLDELKLWERNYNRGDVQQIKKSILRFGFNNALRVWRESTIMAGNHSTIALRECLADDWTETADGIKLANGKTLRGGAVRVVDGRVQVDTVDLSHLPKSEAEAFAIADNHIAQLADPDDVLLSELLTEIMREDLDLLDSIGFTELDVQDMLSNIADGLIGDSSNETHDDEDLEQGERSDGSLLALSDVTIADPKHAVSSGEIWKVGNHFLICVDVLNQWGIWKKYLTEENDLFVPYPGAFAPLTMRASQKRMIMVQPDPYICGHILDRYVEIHGEEKVRRD